MVKYLVKSLLTEYKIKLNNAHASLKVDEKALKNVICVKNILHMCRDQTISEYDIWLDVLRLIQVIVSQDLSIQVLF